MSKVNIAKLINAVLLVVFLPSINAKDIQMQSIYSSAIPLLAEFGVELPDRVSTLTGGSLTIHYKNPGEIVTANQVWDAVSTGAVEAAWYSPGLSRALAIS
jgi:TRAP-type mannitol/chloroaromatic compound transport system substrate-binding protein